jgi:hypothetical protein
MIEERELTELLTSAASGYDPPADGPDRVLDAAAASTPAPDVEPWWRRRRLAIALGVIVLVVGSTVVIRQVGQHGETTETVGRSIAPVGSAAPLPPPGAQIGVGDQLSGADAAVSAGGAGEVAGNAGTTAGGAVGSAGSAASGLPVPASPPSRVRPLGDTAKVVKTGSVDIEVRRDGVGSTMSRLTALATGAGGYVADTKTSEGGDDPTGSVTLRVPAASFDDVVTRARALGTVLSSTTHGQDVTAQYSDIQARLTALDATRNQLLTILRRATAIGDVLSVQDRINQVQTEIEQLQGQQKVLDDQTSYASLSVQVSQHGAKHGPPDKPSGVAKAWDDARHGFTSGVEGILAASGTALVVLLVLAALATLVRFGWLHLRRRLV